MRITVIVVVVSLITFIVASVYGAARWKAKTRELRVSLEASTRDVLEANVDFAEFDRLPTPVQRYFRTVLRDGHPVVTNATVQHSGTFDMGETSEVWKSFVSTQWVSTLRPGFVWNARIAVLPGLPARVHDAYVAGEGLLHASVLGLVRVANVRGPGDIARGELMRYFAEAVWYPTALLESQGIEWTAVSDSSALGTLTDGAVVATLLFEFDADGLIKTVSSESRARSVGGEFVLTPWQGRFWNYETRSGMLVPLDGEVAWSLADGEKVYWRGRITDIQYGFAR